MAKQQMQPKRPNRSARVPETTKVDIQGAANHPATAAGSPGLDCLHRPGVSVYLASPPSCHELHAEVADFHHLQKALLTRSETATRAGAPPGGANQTRGVDSIAGTSVVGGAKWTFILPTLVDVRESSRNSLRVVRGGRFGGVKWKMVL